MAMDTEKVALPFYAMSGVPEAEAITKGYVDFRDYRRPDVAAGKNGGGHNELVECHIGRLADRIGDVGSQPAIPHYVDRGIVKLLQALPESMAAA
jgi:hypothetical protein